MKAYLHHFTYEFRAGVRDRSLMLMNYLFPLARITSYNVCYTKLLRAVMTRSPRGLSPLSLTLLAIPLSLVVLAATGQNQRGGFQNNFTGDIEVVDSSEMRSSRIRFEAGARTNWHVHSERQLLLIEQGQGRVQELGGPIHVLP